MKHLILIFTMLFGSLTLFGQYDYLRDPSFGNGGIVTVPFSISALKGIFLQSDGKMVLLAEHRVNFDSATFKVLRLTADGVLDATYNNTGINDDPTLFSSYYYYPTGLLLPNNELLVAGTGLVTPWYSSSVIVHKYRENGTMDDSFGDGGALSLTEDSLSLFCQDLKVYQDSSILVLYEGSYFGADTVIQKNWICKIDKNGQIDSSFASNGKLEFSPMLLSSAKKMVLSADGSIYILATYNANFSYYDLIVKLNPDFSIDPGFQFVLDDYYYGISEIGVDEDSKLIIAASKFGSGFKLWRYMPNGTLDNSFSKDGEFSENLNRDIGGVRHFMAQPDGKLLFSFTGGAVAMRVNANGTMDYSFDLDGVAEVLPISDANFNYSAASGLVLQPDGKLVFMTEDENDFIQIIRIITRP